MKKLIVLLMTLLFAVAGSADMLETSAKVDGYEVKLFTKKPLVVGENAFFVKITKDANAVTDAKVKVKFFMPEMPGMPYMETKSKGKLQKDGTYKLNNNFSMGGTWQYHLKFKTKDEQVHKIKSSINL